MTLALSTMWAQQDEFVADMHRFVARVRDLGYDAIEVSHVTPPGPFERLLTYPGVRITSIHAPAPLVRDGRDRANSSLNLAALDDDERRAAVEYSRGTVQRAQDAGGRYVVLHLGALGNEMFHAERELRRLYDAGTRDGARVEDLRATCHTMRAEGIAPWLERARETLRELVAYAEPRGIALGLENRLHYHEIPQPEEAAVLLEGYAPAIAGYWHDVGHAEVQARLGLVDKRRWLDINREHCIGAHLHDVDGLADHRAPGRGDVEWDYIAAGLPTDALRVFEINQSQPADAVGGAIPYLRERGVIA